MWALLGLALAGPAAEDVDQWATHLDDALSGPEGCWDFTAQALWAHSQGDNHTHGQATLHGRLEDGVWQGLRLVHPTQDVQWRDQGIDRPLTLQLRPFLGDAGRWALHHEGGLLFVRSLQPQEDLGASKPDTGVIEVMEAEGQVQVLHNEPIGRSRRAQQRTQGWFDPTTADPIRVVRTRDTHRLVGQPLRSHSEWTLSWRYGRPASESVTVHWTRPGLSPATYHHQLQWQPATPCTGDSVPEPWLSDSQNPYLDALRDPAISAEDQRQWDVENAQRRRSAGWTTMGMGLALGAGFGALAAVSPDPARRDINGVFAGVGGGVAALGAGLALTASP